MYRKVIQLKIKSCYYFIESAGKSVINIKRDTQYITVYRYTSMTIKNL